MRTILRRRLLLIGATLGVLVLGREAWWYHRFLGLASAHAAKVACSCVFLQGRELPSVLAEELAPFGLLDVVVDRATSSATASAFGMWERTAWYRPGLGATLVHGSELVLEPGSLEPPRGVAERAAPWPEGEAIGAAPFDTAALDAALADAFADPRWRTRAMVVVHGGHIVAERYAAGFGPDVPQHGWSMTKTWMNALIGILVGQGRLRLDQPAPIPEWRGVDDARAAITVAQLLRMESGLAFFENYEDPSSDVLRMLFAADDMAAYAARQPLRVPPDTRWRYSSGASVLLARVAREVVGSESPEFARDALFSPLGMATARLELDAAGTWVGSSMGWASARDWARFGLLYLRDGVWGGERILPEGWIAASTVPTASAPGGGFGAHLWLNAGDATGRRSWPSLPADLFWAAGYQGQYVVVAPSRDAVIVRLGQTTEPLVFPIEPVLGAVLAALPSSG